ncbi:MAG: hypothetical protein ISS79_01600 [Phycisphaerae bacterium]|nr:hypothetical protein [Phycisphaerae bacterium]
MDGLENNSEPSFQVKAILSRGSTEVASIPCKIWLPKHVSERPVITFQASGKDHCASSMMPAQYDLKAGIVGFDGEVETLIVGKEIWLSDSVTKCAGADESITTFKGEPSRLTVYKYLKGKKSRSDKKTYICFHLTDNFLLMPAKSITRSYTGEVKVRDIRMHVDLINEVGEVSFDTHFYDVKLDDGGVATYRRLVGVLESEIQAKETSRLENTIKPRLADYILVASFASNQRTHIVGWTASDSECAAQTYVGDVSLEKKSKKSKHGHWDVIIDPCDFALFMKTAMTKFRSLSDENVELLRSALYKILPSAKRTVESTILAHFSALETIILLFRKKSDLEFTLGKSEWRKLQNTLREVIRENTNLFSTEARRELLMSMLPSLKRVPLREAFNRYVEKNGVDLSDLWPVLGDADGSSLNDVRNVLIHGDTYRPNQYDALFAAMLNLGCVVQRLMLTELDWPIDKSKVSPKHLRSLGWLGNSDLQSDMKNLKCL